MQNIFKITKTNSWTVIYIRSNASNLVEYFYFFVDSLINCKFLLLEEHIQNNEISFIFFPKY